MDPLLLRLLQFGPFHDPVAAGWMGWAGLLWMVGFALLLAVVVLPVIEATDSTDRAPTEADPARAALRERFARGEIDEAEFDRRLDVLDRTDA
ncbi:MAG: SHOCT domain-containing protein [Halobacteriales archaeon]